MEAPPPDDEDPTATSLPTFVAAATEVAVAQICRSAGCSGASAAALRAISDVAGRFICELGQSAAAAAAGRGRSACNLLDVVVAMEELRPSGFGGAWDAGRPPMRSAVMRELMAFVRVADEVPFPQPVRREKGRISGGARSFAQAGEESPFPHVPRWLPCFPEKGAAVAANTPAAGVVAVNESDSEGQRSSSSRRRTAAAPGLLPQARERKRVKFRLVVAGGGAGRRREERVMKWRDGDEDENGY